ncbi:permease [Calderihabitans maritimus]|uniref:Permease n=1 Tax=Calderihabitans maritimus TaxID=1246530 RepID=A0A1Z5HS48_9FIRM|nr:permease [Calderihabitans maritimus]GAW92346.1 hypothetical protein Dret_0274 [Calderihabitans maritimus]
MGVAVLVIGLIALSLFLIGYRRGDGSHIKGLRMGWNMFKGLLPLLLLAFTAAGLLQVAIPPELIRSWLGEEAGWKGVLIGSVAGALIPGGPYVAFPIIASVFKAGASLGTAVAFITSWAMMGLTIIPFEVAFVGPRFTAVRYTLALVFPFLAGFLAQTLFARGF